MIQDVHVKLNPGLQWLKQHSSSRRFFHQATGLKSKEETSEMLHLEEHGFGGC